MKASVALWDEGGGGTGIGRGGWGRAAGSGGGDELPRRRLGGGRSVSPESRLACGTSASRVWVVGFEPARDCSAWIWLQVRRSPPPGITVCSWIGGKAWARPGMSSRRSDGAQAPAASRRTSGAR
ncbi:hypothetical protein GCM10007856_44050 [Azospirillum oryzae]|nr:hypothetical protein GCM10007856_44050 [Azospirillum oryzae]